MVLNGSVWINLVQTLVLVRVLVLVQVLILLTIISSAKELNTVEQSVRPYLPVNLLKIPYKWPWLARDGLRWF